MLPYVLKSCASNCPKVGLNWKPLASSSLKMEWWTERKAGHPQFVKDAFHSWSEWPWINVLDLTSLSRKCIVKKFTEFYIRNPYALFSLNLFLPIEKCEQHGTFKVPFASLDGTFPYIVQHYFKWTIIHLLFVKSQKNINDIRLMEVFSLTHSLISLFISSI